MIFKPYQIFFENKNSDSTKQPAGNPRPKMHNSPAYLMDPFQVNERLISEFRNYEKQSMPKTWRKKKKNPGLYMIGYGRGKIILKFLHFCRLNEENQERENSKHQMKTKTKSFCFHLILNFPLLKFLIHNSKRL